jgi:hypothetical protein
MAGQISEVTVVVAGRDQFSCPLGDSIVLLDLKAGLYFSLDNVGARVWQLLQQPRTVAEVRQTIVDEFDVSPDRCERDLAVLLQDLAERNLIEIRDAAPA